MGVLSDRQIMREIVEAGRIKNFDPTPDNTGKISAGLSSFGIDVRVGYKFKVFDPLFRGVIDPKNFDPAICRDVDIAPRSDHVWENDKCVFCGVSYTNPHKQTSWLKECIKNIPADHIVLPPHGFALAETIEELTIPRDCLVIALSKSTLLRCGMYQSTSVMEPEWTGTVTLELSNLTPCHLKVYAGEGIAQLVFLRSDERMERLIQTLSNMGENAPRSLDMVLSASCGKSYADKKGRYNHQKGITTPFVSKKESQ